MGDYYEKLVIDLGHGGYDPGAVGVEVVLRSLMLY